MEVKSPSPLLGWWFPKVGLEAIRITCSVLMSDTENIRRRLGCFQKLSVDRTQEFFERSGCVPIASGPNHLIKRNAYATTPETTTREKILDTRERLSIHLTTTEVTSA